MTYRSEPTAYSKNDDLEYGRDIGLCGTSMDGYYFSYEDKWL